MTRLSVVGTAFLLFLQVARCEENIANVVEVREAVQEADGIWARDDDLGKGKANIKPRSAIDDITIDDINWGSIIPDNNGLVPGEVAVVGDVKYEAETGSAQLDGRALIAEWLHPRALAKRECLDVGYAECSDGIRCCPSAAGCCPASRYCKRLSTDVCCGSNGTCPGEYVCHSRCECMKPGATCCSNYKSCASGLKCCSLGGCAPSGGDCCSNGRICDTGNICVISGTSGRYGCCTDTSCTAYASGGSTVTYTTTSRIATVAPPATTRVPIDLEYEYTYYYMTITWYYYYYYFTYYYAIEASTLTSSRTSTKTRISVYETESSEASSSLSSMSRSLDSDFTTPASATTALALSTNVIGGKTTSSSSSSSSTSTSSSVDGAGGGEGGDGNGGASAGRVQASLPGRGLIWGLVGGAAAVGMGMVWL